MDNLEVIKT